MLKEEFFNQKKFFFIDDIEKIAKYALDCCLEEANKIIQIANDVCKQSFIFNLKWDMERTYKPIVFETDIDWLYRPADDVEWTYAFNRHKFFICLGQAYAMTKNEKYAKTFVKLLCDWISRVKIEDEKSQAAWRTIEAGLRLEYWLKAFCYFEKSDNLTDNVCKQFYYSIIEHAEYIMGTYDHFRLISNWGVLENHGLFLAGIMLPETERTKEYITTALQRLKEEITIQVYNDGTHWEQSPMYHNEVMHCYLDVICLATRNNINLPNIIWHKVKEMCYVNLYWKKPDHCENIQGDSDNIDVRDILTKGAYFYNDQVLKYGGYKHFDYDCIWDLGFEAKLKYDQLGSKIPNHTSNALSDSGNYYLRSDWSEESNYLHFHCGPLGGGHGHLDKLHFDLYANGEDILVDAGRYTYVNKLERYLLKSPLAHNTIIVDDTDFTVCIDPWECSKLSQSINQRLITTHLYDFVQGGHLGYMNMKTGSVFINRKIVYIKPDIYIIVDEFYSSHSHKYNQFFHFNNSGTLVSNEKVFYTSDRNYVEMIFASENITKQIIGSKISRHYNSIEDNKAIKTEVSSKGFQSLITVIGTSAINQPDKLQVKKVPVTSSLKGIVFKDEVIEGITIQKGGRSYTIVVAHQEYISPTDTFEADGCIGFGNVVVFNRSAKEERIGNILLG